LTAEPSPADRAGELAALARTAAGCTACELAAGRTNVVFGYGDPDADLMIVGEGPGQHEDEQGLPFVGRSGKLLDQLLEEIGLRREDNVYIGNVVKCRPPGNRDPRQVEIDACADYLRQQLRLVAPLVVVTLGNFSSKLLLRTETGITRLRGRAYQWWGRFLVPTFHPAAALRGSARVLEEMRQDFRLVLDVIEGRLVYEPAESAPESASGGGEILEPTAALEPEKVDQMGLFE
jgi:DNA polymerase